MIPATIPKLTSVLCLGAHADDIEIGCGATLLRLLGENLGTTVHWVVFSANTDRRREALASAKLFCASAGSSQFIVHEFEDSFFPDQYRGIKQAVQAISEEFQPDLIFTHRRNDAHQDHRTIAELTWCAFRNHQILEYEIPKYEGDLGAPNLFVRVDESHCRRKIELLMQTYTTQAAKPWFAEDTFWSLLRLRGVECCSPTRHAEGFYVRKMTI